MPGGGGALATVHSGQSQAATGQHDGSALLQPGLTCTGRTETLLSSGARHRIWANFDRRHSSPRARSDKMLTVRKLRLVQRKRLPCEPAAGWLGWTESGVCFRPASSFIVQVRTLNIRYIVGKSRHRAHTESQREESGESQFLGSLWRATLSREAWMPIWGLSTESMKPWPPPGDG